MAGYSNTFSLRARKRLLVYSFAELGKRHIHNRAVVWNLWTAPSQALVTVYDLLALSFHGGCRRIQYLAGDR